MSETAETNENNNLNKDNKAEANQNIYKQKHLPDARSHEYRLSNKEYKFQQWTTTNRVSKATRLAKTKEGDRTNPKHQVLTLVSESQLQQS